MIDKNGVKIGESNKNETSISKEAFETKEQFSNLTSVKFALQGKSGSILEKSEGKETQITLFFLMTFFKIKNFYYLFKVVAVMGLNQINA